MRLFTSWLAAMLLLAWLHPASLAAQTTEGLACHQVGDGHTLVRVDSVTRYVLLPVQDTAPEAEVRVLTNARQQTSLNVRLAQGAADYYVPLDLAPYAAAGHLLLDIRTAPKAGAQAWRELLALSDTFDASDRERKWRPVYHHTPAYGWMNDPNGMFYLNGEWHLCFQYGPYGSTWNNMTWGHSVSNDLMHWRQVEHALLPDALGSIFSGSAVVDRQGTAGYGKNAVIAMYTQAGRSQFQSMAYSTDGGKTFTPFGRNPVLMQPYEFRDPHVFWHEPTRRWIAILASSPAHEMDIYSSDDLKSWTKESSFGKGYGAQEGVWECPDLMELPVRGTKEKKWVLVCNINPGGLFGGSATQYFVGSFDGHRFVCDTEPHATKWLDYGKDHYAAVSWDNAPEGRRTMIAWMSNWQYANVVPTQQYRSANTLPRELELFRGGDGELYVASTPSPEVSAARYGESRMGIVRAGQSKSVSADYGGAYELDLELALADKGQTVVEIGNADGEKVRLAFDRAAGRLWVDRAQSGVVNFSSDFAGEAVWAPLTDGEAKQSVRVFVDRSSVEIFEAQGRYTVTTLVFPGKPYDRVGVVAGSTGRVASARVYGIR